MCVFASCLRAVVPCAPATDCSPLGAPTLCGLMTPMRCARLYKEPVKSSLTSSHADLFPRNLVQVSQDLMQCASKPPKEALREILLRDLAQSSLKESNADFARRSCPSPKRTLAEISRDLAQAHRNSCRDLAKGYCASAATGGSDRDIKGPATSSVTGSRKELLPRVAFLSRVQH